MSPWLILAIVFALLVILSGVCASLLYRIRLLKDRLQWGGGSTAGGSREPKSDSEWQLSSDHYEMIFNQQFQFMAILSPDGRVLEISRAPLAVVGADGSEFIGKYLWECPAWESMPEMQSTLRHRIEKVREAGEIRVEAERFVTKTGEVRYADASHRAIRDKNGVLRYVLVQAIDRTEQIKGRIALAESEKRFKSMIDYAPEAIVILEPSTGKFVSANPAAERLYKLTEEELRKRGPADLSPHRQPDGQLSTEKAASYVRQAVLGEVPVFEWTHIDSEGNVRPCEIRLLALSIDDRVMVRGSVTDISERKKHQEWIAQQHEIVEAELASAKQQLVSKTRLAAIGEMSAQVAHEIRNPLGAVSNAIYFLKNKVPVEYPKWSQYLQLMEDEIATCNRFITDLLEATRNQEIKLEMVDFRDIVDAVLARGQLPTNIKFSYRSDSEPCMMAIDRGQMIQVMNNLVNNSIEAIGEKSGEIKVTVTRKSDVDLITVRDSGPGIPRELSDKVFDALFTTRQTGTGLGLAVCRQVVERHQGSISVNVECDSGGEVHITLPRQQKNERLS